jgi:anti-sigma28 factor (negative regulator of flagellin synthesis)
MDIGKTDGVGGPGRIHGPNKISRITPSTTTSGAASADKVQLSQKAGMVSKALAMPQVRTERVAEVKKLIESGRFDTDTRLEGALKKFVMENPDLL